MAWEALAPCIEVVLLLEAALRRLLLLLWLGLAGGRGWRGGGRRVEGAGLGGCGARLLPEVAGAAGAAARDALGEGGGLGRLEMLMASESDCTVGEQT